MKRYLTVDEFMQHGFDSDGSGNAEPTKKDIRSKKKRKVETERKSETTATKKIKIRKTSTPPTKKPSEPESDDDDYEDFSSTVAKLNEKDPEFYKYLSENDRELLNIDISEDESNESDTDDPAKKEKFHKPPDKLQVASDESDFSEDEAEKDVQEVKSKRTVVTKELISQWKAKLEEKWSDVSALKSVMLAFKAAVELASDESTPKSPFTVKGATMFNSVVRLCLTSVLPALHKVLRLPPPSQETSQEGPKFNPKKSKLWTRMSGPLRTYMLDIIKMMTVVTEPEVVTVFLRHILHWVPFYTQFPKHSRLLIKKLVTFWSRSEESVRVVAYLCMIRVLRVLPNDYLDFFLKQLYLSYVNNCKFTSPTTWPLINFMKRSLVGMYSLDPGLAYQHAFVYIRQQAIHLRNAMTTRKKDAYQVVYNWQYVHCLLLWSHLLSTLHSSPQVVGLVYPLVQVTLGAINLIQTAKYLPLRFHLIRSLMELSSESGTFIPILPLIVQVFDIVDFNKGHSSLSLKPMDFTCALKLSKSQLQENAFRDGCMQQVYELLMEYLNSTSHLISFPELVFPATIQIKKFLKTCKVANYNRQMKQALDKIEENSKYISEKRSTVSFGVSDQKAVDEWEKQEKNEGTPITKYYATWRKLRDQEVLTAIARKDQSLDINLPTVDRKKLLANKRDHQKEFAEMFAVVSDDDDMDEEMFSRAIQRTEKSNENKDKLKERKKKKVQNK